MCGLRRRVVRSQCAPLSLSFTQDTTVSLFDGLLSLSFPKANFVEMHIDCFGNSIRQLENWVRDSSIDVRNVGFMLVVGFTRTPMVQKMIQKYISTGINLPGPPASQGVVLAGEASSQGQDLLLLDVI